MTDKQAVRIAKKIDRLNRQITELCQQLCEEHPNGERMLERLRDNGFDNPADAQHAIHECLLDPGKWVIERLYGELLPKK